MSFYYIIIKTLLGHLFKDYLKKVFISAGKLPVQCMDNVIMFYVNFFLENIIHILL